jgi:uncharacterized membrane protein YpjA
MVSRAYTALRNFVLIPWVTYALIGINVVAGIVGGIYWYGPDLLRTPWWALVFVPDCPLFTFLFAVALVGIRLGKRWTLFNALTTVGLIKYGLWTITVWVLYWSVGYRATTESVLMTIAHVGMALEGVVLASFLPGLRFSDVWISAAWFFLSDWVDYFLGFRPRMAPGVSEPVMAWEMIFATLALTAVLDRIAWRQHRVGERSPSA